MNCIFFTEYPPPPQPKSPFPTDSFASQNTIASFPYLYTSSSEDVGKRNRGTGVVIIQFSGQITILNANCNPMYIFISLHHLALFVFASELGLSRNGFYGLVLFF